MDEDISSLKRSYPGRTALIDTISTFVFAHSPSFIHLHDPSTFQQTRTLLSDILLAVTRHSPATIYAVVDCALCFTPKLLFTSTLNGLAKFEPSWSNGYKTWSCEDNGLSDGLDGFLHGLQNLLGDGMPSRTMQEERSAVIVFVNPESMRHSQQNMVTTMTRLRELTGCTVSSILLSKLQWEAIYPTAGSLPQPYTITVDPLSKDDLVETLARAFSNIDSAGETISPYSHSLGALYRHYIETLVDICSPFTNDPSELAYIAAARWPGFVAPVIEEWKHHSEHAPLSPPSEEERVRLIRLFSSSLTQAVESLYPRVVSAEEWCERNKPPEGLRLSQLYSVSSIQVRDESTGIGEEHDRGLPRIAQFVLVASFLASHNPAKTDLRMLGHTQEKDGKRPRKRKQGAVRQTRAGTVAKVSQHLLGPTAFSLDRLLAIVGVLFAEHDEDARKGRANFFGADYEGTGSEVEVSRFLTLSAIQELVAMRLLVRTTPPERPDASSMYKCAISYERALSLARYLDVPLNDLIWESH